MSTAFKHYRQRLASARRCGDVRGVAVRHFRDQAIRRSFAFWQRLGVHVTANNFYQPVPDIRALPADFFTRHGEMVGVDMREDYQLQLLDRFLRAYRHEYDALPIKPTGNPYQFHHANGLYGWVDAVILYCVIREFRPRRIYEIGSGYSTLLVAQALAVNADEDPRLHDRELVAIEPYPRDILTGLPGLTRILRRPVQQVAFGEFERLEANDVLFIDSSHVLKSGSDVQYEYLEILPRLKPGVLVHAHDIFLPREYPERWLRREHRFWNEQYLLQAFLAFNAAFEVVFSSAYVHTNRPEALAAACSFYHPAQGSPGSFWLRRRTL